MVKPIADGGRYGRARRAATMWLAVSASCIGSLTAQTPAASDSRDLPTLVVQWDRTGADVGNFVVDDGVAYARIRCAIEAIEIASGQSLWKLPCDQRIVAGPVVLDDRLAVIQASNTLTLIDRSSGVVVAEQPLPGEPHSGTGLAGPPLVAAVRSEEGTGNELLRLDDVTGHVLDRIQVGYVAYLESVRGTTVARVGSDGHQRIIGIRGVDLSPEWEVPIASRELYELDGRVLVGVDEPTSGYLTLDPQDGALKSQHLRWPRQTTEEDAWQLAWDFEVVGRRGPATLRRRDAGSGGPLWELLLPCTPSAWVRDDERLVLDCQQADGGRSLLLVIDLASGEIRRRAPGFHGVSSLAIVDDLGLAASSDGLFAFSLTAEGPAITDTLGIEGEVDAVLNAIRPRWTQPDSIAADLSRIGDAALPMLTERLPALDDLTATAVARVLGDAAYAPAARAVSDRLRNLPKLASVPRDTLEFHRLRDLELALVAALGRVGGERAEGVLGAILVDPGESAYVRRQTSFALAELGTPAAVERLENLRSQTQETRWWSPPDASTWLARTPRPAVEFEDSLAWRRRDQAVLASWVDRRLLIFPDPVAGGIGDLWAAEVQAEESIGEVVFLGSALVHLDAYSGVTVKGRIDGGTLYTSSSPDGSETAFDLTEAWIDSDDDGLTDPLERRFGTDATRVDSDGDGILDPEDLVPQAASDTTLDDEEEIEVAILDSFFRYGDTRWRDGVAFVEADRPLPWSGRTGPTFTVTPQRADELLRELGTWLPPIFSVRPADKDEIDAESLASLNLEAGDRLYIVSAPQEGHFAIVRRIGDRWFVREIRMWWIA